MKVLPENGTVLCEQINETRHEDASSGFVYEKEELPVYRVVSAAPDAEAWKPGDEIVCDSTGTRLKTPEGVKYLFKTENIAGRIRI